MKFLTLTLVVIEQSSVQYLTMVDVAITCNNIKKPSGSEIPQLKLKNYTVATITLSTNALSTSIQMFVLEGTVLSIFVTKCVLRVSRLRRIVFSSTIFDERFDEPGHRAAQVADGQHAERDHVTAREVPDETCNE